MFLQPAQVKQPSPLCLLQSVTPSLMPPAFASAKFPLLLNASVLRCLPPIQGPIHDLAKILFAAADRNCTVEPGFSSDAPGILIQYETSKRGKSQCEVDARRCNSRFCFRSNDSGAPSSALHELPLNRRLPSPG